MKTDYQKKWAINQSALKRFPYMSPQKWKTKYIDLQDDDDKEESYFIFGAFLDNLLFTPSELDSKFYIGKEKIPSDSIAWIIREYFKELILANQSIEESNKLLPISTELFIYEIESSPSLLLKCANNFIDTDGKQGYQKNWKDDTRIKSLIEKGKEYFDSIKIANGRKIISSEQNLRAIEMKNILLTDKNTKDYFISTGEIELIFQLEIFVEYDYWLDKKSDLFLGDNIDMYTILLKGALDILRIDHKNKTLQIADFKTSQSAHNFVESIHKFGYCLQLSFYTFLLKLWIEQQHPEYKNYIIIPPVNLVIDFEKVPYIYEYNNTDLIVSQHGNSRIFNDLFVEDHPFKIKNGWQSILDTISWHISTGNWSSSKEMIENGKIKLNLLNDKK